MPRYRITAVDSREPGGVATEFEEEFPDPATASRALSARALLVTSLVEIPEPAVPTTGQPGAAPAQRDYRADLYDFFGPNADRYLEAMDRLESGRGKFHRPAFLVGPMWAFYRKLYVEGLVLVIVPLALIFVWPELTGLNVLNLVLAAIYGANANRYYINRAHRKIAAINRADLPPEQRRAMIVAAGGVSPVACVLAIVALVALVITSTIASTRIPACTSPDTIGVVEQVMRNIGTTGSMRVTQIADDDAGSTADQRSCRAVVVTDSRERAIRYIVRWTDRAARRFQVEVFE